MCKITFLTLLFVIVISGSLLAFTPIFDGPLDYSSGQYPAAVCASDLNGDNHIDLVVSLNSGYIETYMNSGDGTFDVPSLNETQRGTNWAVAVDLNGDDEIDIAAVNRDSCSVSILTGNGDGTFMPAVNYKLGDYLSPQSITAADLDGDLDPDLAVPLYNSDSVVILFNDGYGQFPTEARFKAGTKPYAVFSVDFDNDNDIDLAVTLQGDFGDGMDDSVVVFYNDGFGAFPTWERCVTGDSPPSLYGGDFDNDGLVDLVVANNGSHNISVIMNDGGSMSDPVYYACGQYPTGVFCFDCDGDNDIDISVVSNYENKCQVFLNDGSGNFALSDSYEIGWELFCVYAADIDEDGYKDLILPNHLSHFITILKSHGDGTFQKPLFNTVAGRPNAVCAADFNHDGYIDVATANEVDNKVTVLINSGLGSFTESYDYVSGDIPQGIVARDLNGDTFDDLAVVCDRHAEIYINAGTGLFAPSIEYNTSQYGYASIAAGDIDGDADYDLIYGGTNTPRAAVAINNGDGTFQPVFRYGTYSQISLHADDLNGDGIDDIILGNGSSLSIGISNGDGTFQPEANYSDVHTADITSGDFNGDGYNDIAASGNDSVKVLINLGDGSFEMPTSYYIGDNPYAVYSADIDNDGDIDIVTANHRSENVGILLNTGTGSFDHYVFYSAGSGPSDVVAVDLDNDHDNDLAVAAKYSNSAHVFFNEVNPVPDCGDANYDGNIDLLDILFIIDYIYGVPPGPSPVPEYSVDTNSDGAVNLLDILILIDFIYGNPPGAAPDCPDY